MQVKFWQFWILILSVQGLFAQEQLNPLAYKNSGLTIEPRLASNVIVQTDTLSLPFVDDFSANYLFPLDLDTAQVSHQVVYNYRYRLLDSTNYNGVENWVLDTTYSLVYALSDTTKTALTSAQIIIWDYTTYPPEPQDTLTVWPNYNLYDTLFLSVFDTTYLTGLSQDSSDFILVVPQENLWLDNDVYINSTYGKNIKSVGVATLDVIDAFGKVHDRATNYTFKADYLTSKPIDLSGMNAQSDLWLSFYMQKGGYGYTPDANDSLVLQGLDTSGNWLNLWSTKRLQITEVFTDVFQYYGIEITDSAFFHNAFQFRFVNMATMDAPGNSWKHNTDHWHLDYVVLDDGRSYNDGMFLDLAIVDWDRYVLNEYTQMPWSHYLQDNSSTISTFRTQVNNNATLSQVFNWSMDVSESGNSIHSQFATPGALAGGSTILLDESNGNFVFTSAQTTPVVFDLTYATSGQGILTNDTVIQRVVFDQDYAYDDGSSEQGYGINAAGGRFAYQYDLGSVLDTLRGIKLFLNHTLNEFNLQVPVKLMVWESENGEPGDIIYEGEIFFPQDNDSLNQFLTYPLGTGVVLTGKFFIGWTQTTNDFLSIGFDQNTDASDKMFFSVGTDWNPSSLSGSVMLRPVFGRLSGAVGMEPVSPLKVKIYPNPNPGVFQMEVEGVANYQIFDLTGKLIDAGTLTDSKAIDISPEGKGVYLIEIQNIQGARTVQTVIVK